MDIRDHDAYMYGWRLWEQRKPRPRGTMNRKGWDAAKQASGDTKMVTLTEYGDAVREVARITYEPNGDVLDAPPRRGK